MNRPQRAHRDAPLQCNHRLAQIPREGTEPLPYDLVPTLYRIRRGRRLRRPAHLPTKIGWEFAGATIGHPFFCGCAENFSPPSPILRTKFHYSFLIPHFLNFSILCPIYLQTKRGGFTSSSFLTVLLPRGDCPVPLVPLQSQMRKKCNLSQRFLFQSVQLRYWESELSCS